MRLIYIFLVAFSFESGSLPPTRFACSCEDNPSFNVVPSLSCFPRRAVVLIIFFPTQVLRHVFLASVPLAAFLIFGPQRDILACWFGWLSCYLRRPKPERTVVPTALTTPYNPRPYTPTVPRELLSPLKEKASAFSDRQHPGPVARTKVSTTDTKVVPSSSSISHVTMPFPVTNQPIVPELRVLVPRGER